MEAVPRLPMISFELKTSTEKVTFGPKIKQYIASFYHEDPETYNEEVHNLDMLRGVATRPVIDITGCQMLKKYYCQLHFLKSRFPMEEGQPCAISFSWKDAHSNMICSVSDIDFEISCVLYNIGALHSQLGSIDSRTNPDGMKMACTHFQCAVWAFQTLRDNYSRMVACLLPPEMMNFMKQICLAQAQECILEKSMLDNRKATIIAKVAVQVVEYYKKSLTILQSGTEDGSFGDILGSKVYKKWTQYISFKVAYHKCVSLLYQGQQAEELQKMGERVAFYQIASDSLEEARKLSSSLQNKEQIDEALAFTLDVVEGKRKAAKNENEFIYHEDVPDKSVLQEVKGASLVKGIPFNTNDTEVSGHDIFARLVPMEAHEASSLYSEQKAQMLRRFGELIETKDQALAEFVSSLQLDFLSQVKTAKGLTQDIVDRAAAMSAQPTAVNELSTSMEKLSDIYHDVEAMLSEIQDLLKDEEQNEKHYQSLMGKRAPSIIATDLSREFQKYMEAHSKANESNLNLQKAMTTLISNLKVLSMPLSELQMQIPSIQFPNSHIDLEGMEQLEKLISKIDEMKTQRATLWNDLRTAVHNDDITGVLVTKEANQSLDDVFLRELEKHKNLGDLIEQNTAAQENILKAIVNSYAEFSESRKYIQDTINKRNATMSFLVTSYDSCEDILSKAQKGLEFYNKLETNVTKLLQRVKSACNVQQEERDQMLKKNKMVPTNSSSTNNTTITGTTTTRAPKLKDYLDSRKGLSSDISQFSTNQNYSLQSNVNPETAAWPPAVRPAPLGSEVNTDTIPVANIENNYSYNTGIYNQQQQYINPEDDLSKRMASLMSKDKNISSYPQQYNTAPQNANYNTYSYPSTNVNTYLTNSYQTISSVAYPQGQYGNYAGSASSGYQSGATTSTSGNLTSDTYSENYKAAQSQIYQNQGVNYANYQTPLDAAYKSQSTPQNQPETVKPNPQAGYLPQCNYSTISQYPQNVYDPQQQSKQITPTPNNYEDYYKQLSSSSYQNYYYDTSNATSSYPTTSQVGVGGGVSTPVVYSSAATATNQPYYNYNTVSSYNNSTAPIYTSQNQAIVGHQTDPNSYSTNQNAYYHNQNAGQMNANLYQNASGYVNNSPNPNYAVGPTNYQIQTPVTQSSENNQYNPYQNQMYTTNPTAYQNYPTTSSYSGPVSYGNYTTPQNKEETSVKPQMTPTTQKTSNVDLLAGLDFSISQAPLTPQVPVVTKETITVTPAVTQAPSKQLIIKNEEKHETVENIKIERPRKDPFQNADVVKQFGVELEKFQKFIDGICNKTANGQTTLELKWKLIQDSQEVDPHKRNISIARCYPLKNRYPDILPYDFSRVQLTTTKDDYINATHIKDVTETSPSFIITQSPLQLTFDDFWSMVWEQEVENIVCIMNDSEFGSDDIYWPMEIGKNISFPNKIVSLQNVIIKEFWTERTILIDILKTRESRSVNHFQFTAWPISILPVCPGPFVQFTKHIIEQQKSITFPILVHCSSGIGRSGVFSLLLMLIESISRYTGALPDIPNLVTKMSNLRKNVLKDREHLKFAYTAFLYYLKEFYRRYEKEPPQQIKETKVEEEVVDPLSILDPLWATKKG